MLCQGTFALSLSGDSILVYQGSESDPSFLFGLGTVPWSPLESTIGTTSCILPSALATSELNVSVAFDDVNDGVYSGPFHGSQSELLLNICTVSKWNKSDSIRYPVDSLPLFEVYPSDPSPSANPTCTSALSTVSPSVGPALVPTIHHHPSTQPTIPSTTPTTDEPGPTFCTTVVKMSVSQLIVGANNEPIP